MASRPAPLAGQKRRVTPTGEHPTPERRARAVPTIAVLTAAWALLLFAGFRPGMMSVDSLVQYEQGLSGFLDNQHPPFGSLLFGLSGRLLGTPAGILAVHLAAIGGGFALLAARAARERPRSAVLLLAATLALPPVWAVASVIWKDVTLAGALLLACAALAARRPRVTLALLLVAVLLRHNALFAAVPLAAGAALQLAATPRRRALALVAALTVFAVAPPLSERIARARDIWPAGQLLAYDLVGIYVRHPDELSRSVFAGELGVDDLPRLYNPASGGPLLFPPGDRPPGIPFRSLAARRSAVTREWVDRVVAHPAAYLAHRRDVFLELLGARGGPVCYPFEDEIDPNPWGLRPPTDGAAYQLLDPLREAARGSFLFRGWPWVALSAIATVLAAAAALRTRGDRTPLWVAASGLGYALPYFAISVSCDFRYLYWTVLSVPAAAAAALASSRARAAGTRGELHAPSHAMEGRAACQTTAPPRS
jgi:hypothetical protein